MTGKTPFLPLDKTKDIEKLIEKNVLSGKFLFPAYFPEIFKDLISRCLEINPKDRIRWNDIIHHKAFSDSSISMKDLMI